MTTVLDRSSSPVTKQGMEAAMEALSGAGARKVVPLAVSIAAHSPLMAPAAAELQAAIDATAVQTPSMPGHRQHHGSTHQHRGRRFVLS